MGEGSLGWPTRHLQILNPRVPDPDLHGAVHALGAAVAPLAAQPRAAPSR